MREVNTKPAYNHLQPFLPEYVDSIRTNDVFHYVGKKVGRCKDNKLRICKVFRFGFEYEGEAGIKRIRFVDYGFKIHGGKDDRWNPLISELISA